MGGYGHRFCIWTGPITLALFFLAMVPAAHFIPPPSPILTAADVAALFAANSVGIRIGSTLMMVSVGTYMAFTAAISTTIRRINGDKTDTLAFAQLLAGSAALFPFLISAVIWTTAAFRPDRDPQTMLLLNDLAWLFLAMPPAGVIQQVLIAIAIFGDRSPRPVLPRWFGYFNIWAALLFFGGALVAYFKTGPFAWDGILAFYLPATVFGINIIICTVLLFKADNAVRAMGEG